MAIAGSDCSGGAGIQADIKTMSALGCYVSSVITAVTVQNTRGVNYSSEVPPQVVVDQIEAIERDIPPVAVKIGMLSSPIIVKAVSASMSYYHPDFLVVDPVMVSTSGHHLLTPEGVIALKRSLVPKATLVTPNIPEAEILADMPIGKEDDMEPAAQAILKLGCKAVLIKGGHLEGEKKPDYLFTSKGEIKRYDADTIKTNNVHGTGCTLSSAITAYLARGEAMESAIEKAKKYITEAIRAGADVKIGEGHGPVNHFFNPEKLIKQ